MSRSESIRAPRYTSPGGTITIGCGCGGRVSSAASSGPRCRRSRARQSFAFQDPMSRWRTLKTTMLSHGCHGSGRAPTASNSAPQRVVLATNAFTPSANACSMARVSVDACSQSSRALASRRNRRKSRSFSTPAGPTHSAQRP